MFIIIILLVFLFIIMLTFNVSFFTSLFIVIVIIVSVIIVFMLCITNRAQNNSIIENRKNIDIVKETTISKIQIENIKHPSDDDVVSSLIKERTKLDYINEIRSFNSCILIDVETTGLSRSSDRIIEVGIAKMENWEITEKYSSLVNPRKHIPSAASKVNGIYDSDVENAPIFSDIAKEIKSRLSEGVVAGYNVSFDLDFLGRELSRAGLSANVTYLDVLPIVRKAYHNITNYNLETVAKHLMLISNSEAQKHRAIDDAILTGKVLQSCITKILSDHDEEVRAAQERRKKAKELRREKYKWSPLLEKNFVFTGLFQGDRDVLEKMLEDVGANLRYKVNSNTDFLVVGDISSLPEWAIERKSGAADRLISLGKKVKKINENEYISMINEANKKRIV